MKAVRNANGDVIGLEVPPEDHPDGAQGMIAVVPIPPGATVDADEEPDADADASTSSSAAADADAEPAY